MAARVVFILGLLLAAGRLDWPQAWAFSLVFGAFQIFYEYTRQVRFRLIPGL